MLLLSSGNLPSLTFEIVSRTFSSVLVTLTLTLIIRCKRLKKGTRLWCSGVLKREKKVEISLVRYFESAPFVMLP